MSYIYKSQFLHKHSIPKATRTTNPSALSRTRLLLSPNPRLSGETLSRVIGVRGISASETREIIPDGGKRALITGDARCNLRRCAGALG